MVCTALYQRSLRANIMLALLHVQHWRNSRWWLDFDGCHSAGVSQRDITSFYPQLATQQEELAEIILEFFEQHLQHRFAEPDCKCTQRMGFGLLHVIVRTRCARSHFGWSRYMTSRMGETLAVN